MHKKDDYIHNIIDINYQFKEKIDSIILMIVESLD